MTTAALLNVAPDVVQTRRERGERARRVVPHEAHAELPPRPSTVDPVDLLETQAASRVSELVPFRYGRMLVSPFTFYRGAALMMADDLGSVPNTGLHSQLCGDAHVGNFGLFASFERRLVFDVNDFDETLPGPFEWDLKRLAASIEVAGRDNGFPRRQRRKAVIGMSKAYRRAMRKFAGMGELELWYARLDVLASLEELKRVMEAPAIKRFERTIDRSFSRDRWQAARKTTEIVDGRSRFRSDPPLLVPLGDLYPDRTAADLLAWVERLVADYADSLEPGRRHLLDQYRLVDVARKVVGVGSVGTRAWILLLEGHDGGDPLVLQAKEAQVSVLQHAHDRCAERGVDVGAPDNTGRVDVVCSHRSEGERVVAGQRIMQAVGDMLLGWRHGSDRDGVPIDYYVRQLRDWKGSFDIEHFTAHSLEVYSTYCAWILARSHARSGDRIAIDTYLRRGRGFDEAVADFAAAYADRNENDHAVLADAASAGRVEVASEES